jgi:hypothetical protein
MRVVRFTFKLWLDKTEIRMPDFQSALRNAKSGITNL